MILKINFRTIQRNNQSFSSLLKNYALIYLRIFYMHQIKKQQKGNIKNSHKYNYIENKSMINQEQSIKHKVQNQNLQLHITLQNTGLLLTSQKIKGETIQLPFGEGFQISLKLIIANLLAIDNFDNTQFVYSQLGCSKSNIQKKTDSKYQQITVKLLLKYKKQEQINSLFSDTLLSVEQLSEQHGLLQYKVTKTDLETLIQLLNIENFSQRLDLETKKVLNNRNTFLLANIIKKFRDNQNLILDQQKSIQQTRNLPFNNQKQIIKRQLNNISMTKNSELQQKMQFFRKKIGSKSVYFSYSNKLLQIRIVNHPKGTQTLADIDQKVLRQDQCQIVQNISQFYAIFHAKVEKQAQNLDNIFATDQNYLTAYFSKGQKPCFSKLKATTIPFNDPTRPKVNKSEPFQEYEQKLDHYFNRKEQKFNQNIKNFQLQAIQRLNDFEQKLINKIKFDLQQKLKKIIIQIDASISKKIQTFAQRLNNIQQQSKTPLVKMDNLLYSIQSKVQQLQKQLCRFQDQCQKQYEKLKTILGCQGNKSDMNFYRLQQQISNLSRRLRQYDMKCQFTKLKHKSRQKDCVIQCFSNQFQSQQAHHQLQHSNQTTQNSILNQEIFSKLAKTQRLQSTRCVEKNQQLGYYQIQKYI